MLARNSMNRYLHSKPSKLFENNKTFDTLGKKATAVYLSGVLVTAPILFFGNMYYGYKMSRYNKYNTHMIENIMESSVKVSYSIFSWGFVFYALFRHINRYEEAEKSRNHNLLYGHYKMHLIPNAYGNISKHELNNFFFEQGIFMRE